MYICETLKQGKMSFVRMTKGVAQISKRHWRFMEEAMNVNWEGQ